MHHQLQAILALLSIDNRPRRTTCVFRGGSKLGWLQKEMQVKKENAQNVIPNGKLAC